ncbi:vanadium-dependent haloperoxidase [Synechococcus sp. CCY9202]|uniref:vanadium-dependent haloperoxidase n=1 Tax=Synechococcus sp. CCY9202 TaxID=174698 RepID=UPI002B21120D|nr:vanadium-dependent haloperoxidase [Synechococcus sp. CCY9202]MEA5423188.1 vanadium-dependent haloperoxidase [Synechococcus sp. CCY9202]
MSNSERRALDKIEVSTPILQRVDLDSPTLNTETVSTDGNTTVIFELAHLATEAVASKTVKIDGLIGPTIAARFYAAAGSAFYEADQLFDPNSFTSLGSKKSDRLLERQALKFTKDLSDELREKFIDNVTAYAAGATMLAQAPDSAPLIELSLPSILKSIPSKLDAKARKLGNKIAVRVNDFYANDGSTVSVNYESVNGGPTEIRVIDRWSPEYRVGGDPSSGLQTFLTPQWGDVRQILGGKKLDALKDSVSRPEPFLLVDGASYDLAKGTIFYDGQTQPITTELIGTLINPRFIAQAQRVVDASANLTQEEKLIAEFWEDGAGTGFPPGTWMEFGRFASELNDNNRSEDARLFFAIGQALHSAGVAAWGLKTETDYARPQSAITELSRLGLLRDEDLLAPGIQVFAYSRETQQRELINGVDWETYQTLGAGYSPPFAEFVSGHSTFSSAAGKIIDLITGNAYFGASVTTTSLIEKSKNIPITLSWATWQDAWLESGISRIYGGIHFDDANQGGLLLGQQIGEVVFNQISDLWS